MEKRKLNEDKPKTVIKVDRSRGFGAKKKPDLFANLRNTSHPLDNILPQTDLVNQKTDDRLTKALETDNQTDQSELTKRNDLVIQINQAELTKDSDFANQNSGVELTNFTDLANQNTETDLTKDSDLVSKLTEPVELLTKKGETDAPEVNNLTKSGKSVNQKDDIGKSWRNYERARSLKTSVVEGFRTSAELKQKVKEFCANQKIDKQDFYNLAAIHYIDHLVNQKHGSEVNKLTLDDRRLMKMWKSKPAIINLYLAYNPENKWRFADDEAAQKYNDVDPRYVELGIINTQFNSGFKKINSFSYYQNEIDLFASQTHNEEMLEFLINHYREKWTGKTGREIIQL